MTGKVYSKGESPITGGVVKPEGTHGSYTCNKGHVCADLHKG